jgi:hypothetical protein
MKLTINEIKLLQEGLRMTMRNSSHELHEKLKNELVFISSENEIARWSDIKIKMNMNQNNVMKEEPENKELLDSALIVKVSNGFLVYENDREHGNPNSGFANERKVFESKESLFEFLSHNL